MKYAVWFALLCAGLLLLAGCGGGGGEKKGETESDLNKDAAAACDGSALTEAAKLPTGWPKIDAATYTQQSAEGPTDVVEGYFEGSVKEAHDEYKKELMASGFDVLFDELEDHDSEVSWKGEGRSGQVALREECGSDEKIFVHITNRPA